MAKMKSAAALAARELKVRLRDELGLKIKSARSENYAGGSSVYIEVIDPSPEHLEAAKVIEGEYVYGYFNGMEDIYEYSAVDNGKPKVSYVFVRPHWSDEIKEAAEDYAKIVKAEERFGYSYLHRVLGMPEFWEVYEKGAGGYESMLAAVKANDAAALAEFRAKAEAGNVIRLV